MAVRGFASDNNSGVSDVVFEFMARANSGHAVGYGDDIYTEKAKQLFREKFGNDIEVFFVFSGTGANVLSIASSLSPFQSVICASTAHIFVDECGAPERFSGCKLQMINSVNGKLTPALIKPFLTGFGFEHHSQPGMISISQSTEMGTVYTPEEIRDIADLAHENGMYLHMDGARLANAVVSLSTDFKSITADSGVDVLSFGGTKNGLMSAESVVFFNSELAKNTKYVRKQAMQLASKMRFLSSQFIAYFTDDLWYKNASHANRMARLLQERVRLISGITITQEVQSNGVFAIIPAEIIPLLQQSYFFYVWDESRSEVRWMTSFDTTEDDIDGFVKRIKELMK